MASVTVPHARQQNYLNNKICEQIIKNNPFIQNLKCLLEEKGCRPANKIKKRSKQNGKVGKDSPI